MAKQNMLGNYLRVNGLDMYYEVHGTGEPLVLLHGGMTTPRHRSRTAPGASRLAPVDDWCVPGSAGARGRMSVDHVDVSADEKAR